MSKLSNIGLYKYAQVKYDKYNTPLMTRRAFQWIYSEARQEWLRLKYKDYEVSEAIRADLRPFNRSFDFPNTSRLNLNSMTPEAEYITAIYADFEFVCNNEMTIYTRDVHPYTKDNGASSLTDPYNQPSNEFPFYMDENDGQPYIQVLSDTLPVVTTITYLKRPDNYNLLSDPDGFVEEEYTQQLEILDLAVRSIELTIENFGKFQASREELQTNGS